MSLSILDYPKALNFRLIALLSSYIIFIFNFIGLCIQVNGLQLSISSFLLILGVTSHNQKVGSIALVVLEQR